MIMPCLSFHFYQFFYGFGCPHYFNEYKTPNLQLLVYSSLRKIIVIYNTNLNPLLDLITSYRKNSLLSPFKMTRANFLKFDRSYAFPLRFLYSWCSLHRNIQTFPWVISVHSVLDASTISNLLISSVDLSDLVKLGRDFFCLYNSNVIGILSEEADLPGKFFNFHGIA